MRVRLILRNSDQVLADLQRWLDRISASRLRPRGAARKLSQTLGDGVVRGAATYNQLVSTGLGLLLEAVRGRSLEIPSARLSRAFETGGELLEFATAGAPRRLKDLGFLTTLAGAAYHLGGFAARAYSLVGPIEKFDELNPSSCERALTRLMLRDLVGLRAVVQSTLTETAGADAQAAAEVDPDDPDTVDLDGILAVLLTRHFHRALAHFEHGLALGERALVDTANTMLGEGLQIAEKNGLVSLWWIYLVAQQLLLDLWSGSLYVRLPRSPPPGGGAEWEDLRARFLAVLSSGARASAELWPSQLTAAGRAVDSSENLVVSMPTSAGKTRVAELAALRAVAAGKRIVVVTPLRALSAQMEHDFESLFGALGLNVSSLYGAAGVLYGDLDALRLADIVISTPEKLDAGLRLDPGMLDSVGLVVLDEGHMVGFNDRGLRYETLIQRLLNRADADGRRIVCLSAVFPSGAAFEDFVTWLRRGTPGDAIVSKWRPTRQRFASVTWSQHKAEAHLQYEGNEDAWVAPLFSSRAKSTRRDSKTFPGNQGELTIATAWRFASAGSVLIYSTQPSFVESIAKCAIEATRRGWVPSLKWNAREFAAAVAIGTEWLGQDHVAVRSLDIGVLVHHGDLPQPFRNAVEVLLRERKAAMAIASPTLAQGINLAASTLVIHSITRGGR